MRYTKTEKEEIKKGIEEETLAFLELSADYVNLPRHGKEKHAAVQVKAISVMIMDIKNAAEILEHQTPPLCIVTLGSLMSSVIASFLYDDEDDEGFVERVEKVIVLTLENIIEEGVLKNG